MLETASNFLSLAVWPLTKRHFCCRQCYSQCLDRYLTCLGEDLRCSMHSAHDLRHRTLTLSSEWQQAQFYIPRQHLWHTLVSVTCHGVSHLELRQDAGWVRASDARGQLRVDESL